LRSGLEGVSAMTIENSRPGRSAQGRAAGLTLGRAKRPHLPVSTIQMFRKRTGLPWPWM
jgi:hypothetical protein